MWRRRILYALAVLCALLGQMFDVGYLFHYIFYLSVTLPALGLLVSLPGMLGVRVRLSGEGRQVSRGTRAGWSLRLENRFSLPVARVTGRVRLRGRMSGEARRFQRSFRETGAELCWEVDTGRCDLVECRVERLWVCDCLGLFALPVRAPAAGTVMICPIPEGPENPVLPEGDGAARPVPKGKSASGEDYELRPYREGDAMRSVHWKMSAKRDELVSRELLEERRPVPVLTFDHFGPPERLDRALDRLAGWSKLLLGLERAHEIRWAHPETGAVRRCEVSCEREWLAALAEVFSDPAPAAGLSILGAPLAVGQDELLWHIHVTGEEGAHEE